MSKLLKCQKFNVISISKSNTIDDSFQSVRADPGPLFPT